MALPPMPGPAPQGGGATGPATAAGPMAGSAAQGQAALKVGFESLQKAVSQLPMGSPLQQSVLKALADIGKHMEKHQTDQSSRVQQIVELLRNAKQGGNPPPPMPAPMGASPPAGAEMPPMPS